MASIWQPACTTVKICGTMIFLSILLSAQSTLDDHNNAVSSSSVGQTETVPMRASTEQSTAYTLTYLSSDRKWRFGFRSEPYDKISAYLAEKLEQYLNQKGLRRVLPQGNERSQITVQLLEVTTHPAAFKKPGMDVSANVNVRDSLNNILFAKGFRGESRTMMNTYGHLINHAVEDLVRNILSDESFLRAVATNH